MSELSNLLGQLVKQQRAPPVESLEARITAQEHWRDETSGRMNIIQASVDKRLGGVDDRISGVEQRVLRVDNRVFEALAQQTTVNDTMRQGLMQQNGHIHELTNKLTLQDTQMISTAGRQNSADLEIQSLKQTIQHQSQTIEHQNQRIGSLERELDQWSRQPQERLENVERVNLELERRIYGGVVVLEDESPSIHSIPSA
ncbi:MAG: hypothetical protein J3Q66DRAFT_326863 [Benniella sp.]|nr:MAG: hypothetical protein J3Q66DRAFT_326863 [Benniella sp.]